MDIERVIPGRMLSLQFRVFMVAPASSEISYRPASTQLLPILSMKTDFKKYLKCFMHDAASVRVNVCGTGAIHPMFDNTR